jgi:transcriptional antiterminator
MYLENLQRLIEAIEQRSTGNAREISQKLNVSERMVYNYLDVLKNEFGAPIKYSRAMKSYFFTEEGKIELMWQDGDEKENKTRNPKSE